MAAATAALQRLAEVARRPNRPVVYAPPEMVPHWQQGYAQELRAAAAAALDAGAAPDKVHRLLDDVATRDLDGLPPELLALCLEGGLSPDTDLGGESLLHFLLNDARPVPLGSLRDGPAKQQQPGEKQQQAREQPGDQQAAKLQAKLRRLQASIPVGQRSPSCGSVTLAELLRRRPQPNLADASGNTALHMVVACMVSKRHFPDPRVGEGQQQQQQQQEGEEQQQQQQQEEEKKQAAAAAPPDAAQLQDNDAPRAAYAAAAFAGLLDAGWHPGVRNSNGYTVTDLILEGLARYQAELHDLRDPEGVAQTTVALLSSKAPERGLQAFLAAKIEGVQAVVDALLLMHRLAAQAEAPRRARSAAGLVLLWLLLLAGCVWWMLGRQQWRVVQ